MKNQPSVDFADLVWGVPAIAEEVKLSKRKTQHLIDKGVLEVGRAGPKTIFASRTRLRQNLAARMSRPTEKSEST